MKAKEYAEKFIQAKEEDRTEVLTDILTNFYEETVLLVETRKAKKNSAIFAIFDEMDNKWRSFVRRTGFPLGTDGFKLMVKKLFKDEVYDTWMAYNKHIAEKSRKTDSERRSEIVKEIVNRGRLKRNERT